MRPPTESKTAEEKEKDISQSKLRFKTVGPYTVVSSTNETVTIKDQGVEVVVSIDRCVPDPRADNLTAEAERLYEADDITFNDDNELEVALPALTNPTDETEYVLRHEPEPEPVNDPEFPTPEPKQVLSRTRAPDGSFTYQVRYSDESIHRNVVADVIPKALITDFHKQEAALTQQPTTTRRKGRPKVSDQHPLRMPQSSLSQPSAAVRRYMKQQN